MQILKQQFQIMDLQPNGLSPREEQDRGVHSPHTSMFTAPQILAAIIRQNNLMKGIYLSGKEAE